MKLLAWDTSSKVGALVAIEWDPLSSKSGWDSVRMVGEWTLNVSVTHSERLLWAIHQLLESARWKIGEVDLFGVGVGPGSFTGLRIGVTTARSLAHALNKPLIPVSSLAALARPAAIWLSESKELSETIVVGTTDACKGELFAIWGSARSVRDCVCLPYGDFPCVWKRGVEEGVIRPEELMSAIQKKLSQKESEIFWTTVGEGRQRYSEIWNHLPSERELRIPFAFSDHVQGRYLGQLAWEAYQAGCLRQALQVYPRYVRASDAELKLKAGVLRPAPGMDNL